MRVMLQRVTDARVRIDGQVVGEIGRGLVLLVAIADTDTQTELDWMVRKCLDLRIFPAPVADSEPPGSSFQQSLLEIQGQALVVSQFTLYGDCRKGRRPSFDRSAAPDHAVHFYNAFVYKLRETGLTVATGEFGANMQVELVNDGPVTLLLEREAQMAPGRGRDRMNRVLDRIIE